MPEGVARNIILEASWAYVLALYTAVAFNCSDSNSLPTLDKFEHMNTNHRIQNLIMAEAADSSPKFIGKAIKLFESNDDNLQRYLVQRVAEIHVIKHPAIKTAELHRLNSKVLKVRSQAVLIKKRRKYGKD